MYCTTDEQRMLVRSAREFGQREIQPAFAAQLKKGRPLDFCWGIWDKVAEAGFIGISTPEEMGGLGLGVTEELLVLEELSMHSTSIGSNIDAHNLALRALEYNGSEYQKEKYGKPAAAGEIVLAAGVTDPAGSSNLPEWSITVTEDGDSYILNGTKFFVTNVGAADVYAIFTRDIENGFPMGCYLVEKDTPGLEPGKLESFGRAGTCTGTLNIKNVRIPKENKLPSGDFVYAPWLALGYLDVAAIYCAMCKTALDKTQAYLQQRTRNNRPLASLQAVAHRLANMNMQYEQARSLMYTAARLWDEGRPDYKLHSMAKIASSEAVSKITHDCCVLMGSYGSSKSNGMIQMHTFAPACAVGEHPNDYHRDLIAKHMGIQLDSHLA